MHHRPCCSGTSLPAGHGEFTDGDMSAREAKLYSTGMMINPSELWVQSSSAVCVFFCSATRGQVQLLAARFNGRSAGKKSRAFPSLICGYDEFHHREFHANRGAGFLASWLPGCASRILPSEVIKVSGLMDFMKSHTNT